jgi:hypothetical protein
LSLKVGFGGGLLHGGKYAGDVEMRSNGTEEQAKGEKQEVSDAVQTFYPLD